jgi:hypothetical protein
MSGSDGCQTGFEGSESLFEGNEALEDRFSLEVFLDWEVEFRYRVVNVIVVEALDVQLLDQDIRVLAERSLKRGPGYFDLLGERKTFLEVEVSAVLDGKHGSGLGCGNDFQEGVLGDLELA